MAAVPAMAPYMWTVVQEVILQAAVRMRPEDLEAAVAELIIALVELVAMAVAEAAEEAAALTQELFGPLEPAAVPLC